jgi:prepilin-type processing-associated H-X9-DG protein
VAIESQASTKSTNPDKDTVFKVKAVACDYISSNGLLLPRGGYGLNANATDAMIGNQRQPMLDNEYLPLAKITDGTSCTLLLIEQAGRPNVWRNGKTKDGDGQFGMSPNARGAWAGWGSIAFGPADAATGESPGKGDSTDCTVNCNNWFGIYGFHAAGANVLMCDGSVRFVGPKLDPLTLAYLTLRDDGHLIAPTDF